MARRAGAGTAAGAGIGRISIRSSSVAASPSMPATWCDTFTARSAPASGAAVHFARAVISGMSQIRSTRRSRSVVTSVIRWPSAAAVWSASAQTARCMAWRDE